MPIYTYKCDSCGDTIEQFNAYEDYLKGGECHGPRRLLITPPLTVQVDNMPAYRCIATGETITSRRQRRENFARNGFIDANDFGPAKDVPKPPADPRLPKWEDVVTEGPLDGIPV